MLRLVSLNDRLQLTFLGVQLTERWAARRITDFQSLIYLNRSSGRIFAVHSL
jgi:hypothetical protein